MIPTPETLIEVGAKTFLSADNPEAIRELLMLHLLSGMTKQLDFSVDLFIVIVDLIQQAQNASTHEESQEILQKVVAKMSVHVAMLSEQRDSMEEDAEAIIKKLSA